MAEVGEKYLEEGWETRLVAALTSHNHRDTDSHHKVISGCLRCYGMLWLRQKLLRLRLSVS